MIFELRIKKMEWGFQHPKSTARAAPFQVSQIGGEFATTTDTDLGNVFFKQGNAMGGFLPIAFFSLAGEERPGWQSIILLRRMKIPS